MILVEALKLEKDEAWPDRAPLFVQAVYVDGHHLPFKDAILGFKAGELEKCELRFPPEAVEIRYVA